MPILKRSIAWQLIVPVPLTILVVVIASFLLLPNYLADNSRQDARQSAQQTAQQFKLVRKYYTENVIRKVVQNKSLKPSFNHKTMPDGVPLPATLIHDMSDLLAKSDTQIKLYSPYPFANRADRKLDAFQQAAWDHLQKNPQDLYVRSEMRDGREFVRVGISDTMVAQGCVNCHNSRPDTPKNDWKLGQLRGVLEVATAIDIQLARGEAISRNVILSATVVGIVLTLITFMTAKQITGPVKRMTNAMTEIAGGNTDIAIPGLARKNEIGAMAKAVEIFRQDILDKERLETEQAESQNRAAKEKNEMMNQTAESFQASVGSVVEAVSSASTKLQSSAQSMTTTAMNASEQSTKGASAAKDASANVDFVSSAAANLTTSINEIERQVSQSSAIAKEASVAVDDTNEKVRGLAAAAEKIGEVVQLITDVAEQTNLLALNATIEAARAGDAGKGFAVVASEVKNLANQTARATDQISQQIDTIQSATRESVGAIDGIGTIVTQINEIASAIATSVKEQGSATQEIARNTEAAAQGTLLVTQNINLVTSAAGETGETAAQVLDAASELARQADKMRTEVDQFVERIRQN